MLIESHDNFISIFASFSPFKSINDFHSHLLALTLDRVEKVMPQSLSPLTGTVQLFFGHAEWRLRVRVCQKRIQPRSKVCHPEIEMRSKIIWHPTPSISYGSIALSPATTSLINPREKNRQIINHIRENHFIISIYFRDCCKTSVPFVGRSGVAGMMRTTNCTLFCVCL